MEALLLYCASVLDLKFLIYRMRVRRESTCSLLGA
jgi:hypothetical protein